MWYRKSSFLKFDSTMATTFCFCSFFQNFEISSLNEKKYIYNFLKVTLGRNPLCFLGPGRPK